MGLRQAPRFLRTIGHLRPVQPVHRARLRTQRVVVRHIPDWMEPRLGGRLATNVGWPAGYSQLDAKLAWCSTEDLDAGRFTLLGCMRELGSPPNWHVDAEQLWKFHLHYWDWAWGLAQDVDRPRGRAVFDRLLTSWFDQTRFGHGDEWSPYVVALRAWSWCGQYDQMVRGSDIDEQFVSSLGLHARFLKWHLEKDVGGNHLIKNLKALVGLSVFLGNHRLFTRTMRRLEREVTRQVLSDGGHFERAPAYHCQVLGDLADLEGLLGDGCPKWLSKAVQDMRTWLGLVLLPDGTVPLFNDGYPVDRTLLQALAPGPVSSPGLTLLPESGLAVLRRGDLFVLADVGLPCPDELPAHSHADTLAFWFYAGMTRLVGECGTSTYEAGPVRARERGTAAHSTVQVDGADSTEVWGAFRAGRRARPTVLHTACDATKVVLVASHDGYRFLSGRPIHTRTWVLTGTDLRIVDDVLGHGEHDIAIRLHGTPQHVVSTTSEKFSERRSWSAEGWNQRADSVVLEYAKRAQLPWQFEVILTPEESE